MGVASSANGEISLKTPIFCIVVFNCVQPLFLVQVIGLSRSVADWNENDLRSLINNQAQESLYLDYKASTALDNNESNKTEISKDVSAFANSDGGMIIYGIAEKNHLPQRIDGGIAVEGKREWLEQVINSNIQPRIQEVRIKQIDLTSDPGKAVFVVDVPAGYTAHQAADKRYYRRFNFQSIPMYDYEIKQVINRHKEPILNLSLGFPFEKEDEQLRFPLSESMFYLTIILENEGKVTAESGLIDLFIPTNLDCSIRGEWKVFTSRTHEGQEMTPLRLRLSEPIYPGYKMQISGMDTPNKVFLPNLEDFGKRFFENEFKRQIFYEIYSTDSSPKRGYFEFRFRGLSISATKHVTQT